MSGGKVQIDLNSLTFREMIDFEDIAQVPLDEFVDKGTKKSRALLALTFISMRRQNPDVTLDEVMDLEVQETVDLESALVESEPDPTSAGE